MPWTTPQTWTTNQLVTASDLNTDIRDNLNFLYTAKAARIYRNSNQSITNTTLTALSLSTATTDSDSFWSAGSPTRLTIPATLAGWFVIFCHIEWATNATGYRRAFIRLNGTTAIAEDIKDGQTNSNTFNHISTGYALTSADYLEVIVAQSSGGNLNLINSGIESPVFGLHYVGN